jgi:hypothetical protein
MDSKTIEFWFTWFWAIGLVVQGFFWIIFAQFTMRKIEKRPEFDSGRLFLKHDKGVRVFSYAFVILFPVRFPNQWINSDAEIIQKYATRADWWRALLFYSTHYTWLIVFIVGAVFGDFDMGAESYR